MTISTTPTPVLLMSAPIAFSGRLAFAALVIAGLQACHSDTSDDRGGVGSATVQFKLESPLCGSGKFGLHFQVDHQEIGADTLANEQLSRAYTVTAGQHLLTGLIPNRAFTHDTTATLQAGQTFVALMPLYCS